MIGSVLLLYFPRCGGGGLFNDGSTVGALVFIVVFVMFVVDC